MKYIVQISETLIKRVEIEADSCEEALSQIESDYYNNKFEQLEDDYLDGSVQFNIVKEGI